MLVEGARTGKRIGIARTTLTEAVRVLRGIYAATGATLAREGRGKDRRKIRQAVRKGRAAATSSLQAGMLLRYGAALYSHAGYGEAAWYIQR